MPNILALDTTTSAFSVALRWEGVLFHHFELAPRAHTLLALPTIDRLLKQAGITLQHLDALAVTKGPGGFSGVRTGIALIQGLALGANRPVLSFSTLEVLAQKALRLYPDASQVLTALDARQKEIYWAAFEQGTRVISERVVAPLHAPFPASDTTWHGIGSGWDTYGFILHNQAPFPVHCIPHEEPDAQDLLFLAEKFYPTFLSSAFELEPIYLRNTVTHT